MLRFNSGITKLGAIIGIFLIVVILGSVAAAYYYLYLRTPEPQVDIQISHPDRVLVGEPFSASVSYANRSDKSLQGAVLSLVVPDGISILGIPPERRVQEITVGNIPSGSQQSREFNLLATQDPQTLKELKASLRYHILESPNATFESENSVDVSIGQPAVTLNFITPEEIISGEQFDVTIEYINQSDYQFDNLALTIQEPQGFNFKEATPEPAEVANNTRRWNVEDLGGKEDGSINFIGTAQGPAQSFVRFLADLQIELFGYSYSFTGKEGTVGISSAPLTLDVTVNNQSEYIARTGETLRYRLHYRNNSDTTLHNAQASATFTGSLFDFATMETEGSFSSVTNTVRWNTANTPELQSIAPGEEGILLAEVELAENFPIQGLSDRDYVLEVEAGVESPTVPQEVTAEKTISLATFNAKVAGEINIDTQGFFYEPSASILNNGPYPPKVNESTQYTVHWIITNYATDVEDVKISAFLQSGARFTGVVESNANTEPVHNSATGEVTWSLPSIPATRGVISPPLEAIFQIEATPAINQAGEHMPLLSATQISVTDVFTGITLEDVDEPLTSELPDDSRIPETRREVRE